MPKSVVAGVSGAVRIFRLKRHELQEAEYHGKRLDDTGKARRIREAAPVTRTGLEIMDLYQEHIVGAFVPQGDTVALHMICQFPTELVEASSADWMLEQSRAFAETIFGDRAIFADRVDRDEKGEHIVDLFLAPRYTKKTKLAEREAVSISKHMKDLAERDDAWIEYRAKKVSAHAEPDRLQPNLFFQGRALQTAWFNYLRDEAQICDIQRGSLKRLPGDDWMPAEVLDVERRQEAVAIAEAEALQSMQAAMKKGSAASDRLAAIEQIAAARARERAVQEAQLTERQAAADAAEQAIISASQAAAAQQRHADALKAGIEAYACGDIVDATHRDGRAVISFKDNATKVRLTPIILPAMQAVWAFVKSSVERLAELLRAAIEDRRIAALERATAENLARGAQRKIDEATAAQHVLLEKGKQAAKEAETKSEFLIELARMIAIGNLERDGDSWYSNDPKIFERCQALMKDVPNAKNIMGDYLTHFGGGIDQKQLLLAAAQVTPAHVAAAAAKMVTPELLKDVIEKKMMPMEAVRVGLAAANQQRGTHDVSG